MNTIDKIKIVGTVDAIVSAYKYGIEEGLSLIAYIYANPYDEEIQCEEYYAFYVGYRESFSMRKDEL